VVVVVVVVVVVARSVMGMIEMTTQVRDRYGPRSERGSDGGDSGDVGCRLQVRGRRADVMWVGWWTALVQVQVGVVSVW
jgi:hypothetical protein